MIKCGIHIYAYLSLYLLNSVELHSFPGRAQTHNNMCNLQYFFALVSFVLVLLSVSEVCRINAVPAIFVFGDSLVDVGNNNYIKTKSVANHKPHGIDFGKPTGRYTNGKTIIDIIGQKLGAKKFIPPYLAPTTKGNVILKGVNYASGSSGILNETGIKFFVRYMP